MSTIVPVLSTGSQGEFARTFESSMRLLRYAVTAESPTKIIAESVSSWNFIGSFSDATVTGALIPTSAFPIQATALFITAVPIPTSPSKKRVKVPS